MDRDIENLVDRLVAQVLDEAEDQQHGVDANADPRPPMHVVHNGRSGSYG